MEEVRDSAKFEKELEAWLVEAKRGVSVEAGLDIAGFCNLLDQCRETVEQANLDNLLIETLGDLSWQMVDALERDPGGKERGIIKANIQRFFRAIIPYLSFEKAREVFDRRQVLHKDHQTERVYVEKVLKQGDVEAIRVLIKQRLLNSWNSRQWRHWLYDVSSDEALLELVTQILDVEGIKRTLSFVVDVGVLEDLSQTIELKLPGLSKYSTAMVKNFLDKLIAARREDLEFEAVDDPQLEWDHKFVFGVSGGSSVSRLYFVFAKNMPSSHADQFGKNESERYVGLYHKDLVGNLSNRKIQLIDETITGGHFVLRDLGQEIQVLIRWSSFTYGAYSERFVEYYQDQIRHFFEQKFSKSVQLVIQ